MVALLATKDHRPRRQRVHSVVASFAPVHRFSLLMLLVVTHQSGIFPPIISPVNAEENEGIQPTMNNRVDELRSNLHLDFGSVDLTAESSAAATDVSALLGATLKGRLTDLYERAVTSSCRAKIAEHFGYFVNAIASEQSLPFTDVTFPNECGEPVYEWDNLPEGMHIGDIQNRTYQPPRNESVYIDDPAHLKLLFAVLTHDNPTATIRLIENLYEEGLHQFVIHVDGKNEDTQQTLLEYAADKDYVHILSDMYRVRVNWGGFTMVNATLQTLRYAFALDDPSRLPMEFHKLVHLSSSSYPLKPNVEIRQTLSSYPLDANFLNVIMQPTRSGNYAWHYFVECDDALHRIFQLPSLRREVAGIDMYTSSQWFIISHEFAQYLAEAAPGSMVDQYLRYIEHVVVADETFFGTVLRHTKFCHKHHNTNFLHLQFDRWESELPVAARDRRKCPMPDPDHCGRSPTTMTIDYADILELSEDLFARKFDDSVGTDVKDIIDRWRRERALAIGQEGIDQHKVFGPKKVDFEGHGVLIVANETVGDDMPLCLAIGSSGNKLKLLPCFEKWVPATLAHNWESGAVVLRETVPHTRWKVSPCTSDGHVERLDTGEMNVTLGSYSATGPRCMLQQMDGMRAGRCYDGGSTNIQPGGPTQVYPCLREWFQFVSFGDGRVAPKGSLYSTIPSHIVKQLRNLGHEQIPYMCLGVYERGVDDELDWNDENYQADKVERAARKAESTSVVDEKWKPLSGWKEDNVMTTQCTNAGAVIEWVFVPFIAGEETLENDKNITTPTKNATTEVNQGVDQEL